MSIEQASFTAFGGFCLMMIGIFMLDIDIYKGWAPATLVAISAIIAGGVFVLTAAVLVGP